MIGVISWLACGLLVGFFVSRLMSAQDKGLFALTLAVGCAGGLVGGMCAQIAVVGSSATFSFYGMIFALVGAALALFGYRRVIGVLSRLSSTTSGWNVLRPTAAEDNFTRILA